MVIIRPVNYATDKRFISELMPRSPIYICLLPEEAQEVIGKVHKNTIPALKMLQDEGFKYHNMVDIFDAGPMIVCELEDIRIVKKSIRRFAPMRPSESH